MNGGDFCDDVAQLEQRIEALAQARERCSKISFAAKIVVMAGGMWIVLTLVTVVPFAPGAFFAALAAAIGGTVLLGSNKTTWEETEAALQKAEKTRQALIEQMELRVVGDAAQTLH